MHVCHFIAPRYITSIRYTLPTLASELMRAACGPRDSLVQYRMLDGASNANTKGWHHDDDDVLEISVFT